jgi:hypothetical protein
MTPCRHRHRTSHSLRCSLAACPLAEPCRSCPCATCLCKAKACHSLLSDPHPPSALRCRGSHDGSSPLRWAPWVTMTGRVRPDRLRSAQRTRHIGQCLRPILPGRRRVGFWELAAMIVLRLRPLPGRQRPAAREPQQSQQGPRCRTPPLHCSPSSRGTFPLPPQRRRAWGRSSGPDALPTIPHRDQRDVARQ